MGGRCPGHARRRGEKKTGRRWKSASARRTGEPLFCVTDLLPHLAAKQNERPLKDGLKGEELNIVIGSIPFADDEVEGAGEAVGASALK